MLEHWERWEPIRSLSSKYYIDSISDGIREFRIVLSDSCDEKKKIHVVFENSVDAYRSTDESFRQSTVADLGERYGNEFYGDWTFFKVTNSTYISWLSEQSYGIAESLSFIHFSFVAANSILDVVTTYEPKIELIAPL